MSVCSRCNTAVIGVNKKLPEINMKCRQEENTMYEEVGSTTEKYASIQLKW